VPNDSKSREIVDRFFRMLGKHLARMDQSPQGAQNFHVEQMRAWRSLSSL